MFEQKDAKGTKARRMLRNRDHRKCGKRGKNYLRKVRNQAVLANCRLRAAKKVGKLGRDGAEFRRAERRNLCCVACTQFFRSSFCCGEVRIRFCGHRLSRSSYQDHIWLSIVNRNCTTA